MQAWIHSQVSSIRFVFLLFCTEHMPEIWFIFMPMDLHDFLKPASDYMISYAAHVIVRN